MSVLTLPLKSEYFDAIRDGTKGEEYRLVTPFWTKRLAGRVYDHICLTKGYPKLHDPARRIYRAWRGVEIKTITHPHFGAGPVEVYAIQVADNA